MEHDIKEITEHAEELVNELIKTACFDKFLRGCQSYMSWYNAYEKDIPAHIHFACGCTRVVFWDENDKDYVYKLNMYTDDIDYGKQEEFVYHKAEEANVAECFAWVHKILTLFDRSIYAMPYCHVSATELSCDSYEYHARAYCEEEGYDYDNLTDEQKDEVNEMIDGYSDGDGMVDYISTIYDSDLFHRLCAFIDSIGLNDLHCGNWGYCAGQLVAIDYAGYERDLMQEVRK